jgi:amino acid transporter
MSGIVATVFMVLAVASFNGGQNAKFVVVLTIAISTTLISYLWIFPAAVKLRYSHGHIQRPYRVPGGKAGMLAAGIVTTFWVALGSWVAVFPGTLESLFGIDYAFKDEWGVTRGTYEALTLGTLGVVVLIAVVGYALSGSVRSQHAELALEREPTVPATP